MWVTCFTALSFRSFAVGEYVPALRRMATADVLNTLWGVVAANNQAGLNVWRRSWWPHCAVNVLSYCAFERRPLLLDLGYTIRHQYIYVEMYWTFGGHIDVGCSKVVTDYALHTVGCQYEWRQHDNCDRCSYIAYTHYYVQFRIPIQNLDRRRYCRVQLNTISCLWNKHFSSN